MMMTIVMTMLMIMMMLLLMMMMMMTIGIRAKYDEVQEGDALALLKYFKKEVWHLVDQDTHFCHRRLFEDFEWTHRVQREESVQNLVLSQNVLENLFIRSGTFERSPCRLKHFLLFFRFGILSRRIEPSPGRVSKRSVEEVGTLIYKTTGGARSGARGQNAKEEKRRP
jgi:hypothetical protein